MPKGDESGADDEEDRELKLLSAAIAMAEASADDGEDTTENEEPPHPSTPPIPSDAKEGEQQEADAAILNSIAVEIAATMLSDGGGGGGVAMTPKLPTGSMRRCGLCGGSSDGERAADPPSDTLVTQGSVSSQLLDENCPADGASEGKKADGFGADKGWLGRLLGPLGEHVGVSGAWIHENCAIWSPEVYFSGIGRLKNVKAAVRRGRYLRCSRCNHPGATIGCRVDRCPQNFHLPCARAEGCMFNHRKYLMACYDHSYLFRHKRKKSFWNSSKYGHGGVTNSTCLNWTPKISKAQRRAAASAARLKDVEAEEKYLDKSGEDEEFVRRERKRLLRDLAQIAPVKLGGTTSEKSLGAGGDGWDSVAGLQDVVQCLKEMVTLPLLYPEAFQRLGISPPRGVLLHGHPGTGKTLVVRALASACSRGGQQVAYFARKGADILGKYVGDSERQLRLLFQVAEQCQPAIIFFDEIDGLAPSRCGDRDQTQSSVVSTLLALMDGLNSRGSVVVIGATNRPDSLDPALRRPGRFDREIYFPLPSTADRAAILRLHTKTWVPAPSQEILSIVAKATPGFAGADLQALCVEAAMTALRRVVPLKEILNSAQRGILETKLPCLPPIQVKAKDWASAIAHAPLPCSRRQASTSLTQVPAAPLPRHLVPTLLPILVELLVMLGCDARVSLPPSLSKALFLVELALKTVRSGNTINGGNTCRVSGPPENWLTMVQTCFKQNPTLAKALENGLTSAGIIAETYDASCSMRPVSTILFPDKVINSGENCSVEINGVGDNHTGDQTASSTNQVCINEHIDEVTTKTNWQGGTFRILLLGDGKQGQNYVAGAFIHGFEGLAQMRTLSLPGILMEGGGDVEQGLIYIIGEARRSAPCVLYMPKIEDWVVNSEGDGKENTDSPSNQNNSASENHLSKGRSQKDVQHDDSTVLEVSNAWKLMKQQLQTMPPDTQLMLMATSEAGVGALPSEVTDFFTPSLARSLSKGARLPAQVIPCVCIQLPSHFDRKIVLDRASQDIVRALATTFKSRVARLREEYNAGCSAEKPKTVTSGGVKLSTSVQRMIADRVSLLRSRVQADLGKDLRNIGQDWARNFGKDTGSTYANDLAKVFGIDVGRGLGLDLEVEIKDLGSGLVDDINNEMRSIDSGRSTMGNNLVREASKFNANQHDNIRTFDVESDPQQSKHVKSTRFTSLVEPTALFSAHLCGTSQHTEKIDNFRGICSTADLTTGIQNQSHPVGIEEIERQPASAQVGAERTEASKQLITKDTSVPLLMERKALQSAISFCGYRLLQDPQLAELRSATTMLRVVPTFNVHDCTNDSIETFDWETLEFCSSNGLEKVSDPQYVRGLTAIGLKAQRGVYQTGREVEYELHRVIEALYARVQQKLNSGKDGLQYLHLTSQAATLLDIMASWVHEVHKLEVAANMHSLPIAKSILEFSYEEEELQDFSSQRPQEVDEDNEVEAVNGHHGQEPVAVVAHEGGSEAINSLDECSPPLQNFRMNCILKVNGCTQKQLTSGSSGHPIKKVGFIDDILKTSRIISEGIETDGKFKGVSERGNAGSCGGQGGFAGPAPEDGGSKEPVLPTSNVVQHQQQSEAAGVIAANSKRPLLCNALERAEACLEDRTPSHTSVPMEGSTFTSPVSKRKTFPQAVYFKADCLHQLEHVVKEFLSTSCKEQGLGASVEALHDLVTGCAASALAASQNVLCKSEKTKITHQVILHWAGLTCHCGSDKAVESPASTSGGGETPKQISFHTPPPAISYDSTSSYLDELQRFSRKRKRSRSRSRSRATDILPTPAKKPTSSTHGAPSVLPLPSPMGLMSPLKQTNSSMAYTCLRPVIRVVSNLIPKLTVDKESRGADQ